MKRIIIALLLLCTHLVYALPKGFVYLSDVAPDIMQDMRYFTANNFIGNPIPGYKKGVCIISKEAAEHLKNAQAQIKKQGYSLKVYDCYRPQQAVDYFYKWSQDFKDERRKAEFYPREVKQYLFERRYISLTSGHTRGSTFDLTLVKLDHGKGNPKPLTRCYDTTPAYLNDDSIDTGTRFDCLDKSANIHYQKLSKQQLSNRLLLQNLMINNGFEPFFNEWWHYTLKNEPYPNTYFNFVVK